MRLCKNESNADTSNAGVGNIFFPVGHTDSVKVSEGPYNWK